MEIYTNGDYEKLEGVDFRTLRRHNKPLPSDRLQEDTISELDDSDDEPISKIKHLT